MKRRKRRAHRAPRSLTDRIAVGAMVFSAVLLLVSAIATNQTPDSGPALQAQAEENNQRPAASDADRVGTLEPGDDPVSTHADFNKAGIQNKPARAIARNPSNPPNLAGKSHAPGASTSADPEPADTAGPDTPSADIAAMESGASDASSINVVRAQFTTGIDDSRPVNSIRSVFSTNGQVFSLDGRPLRRLYYFTEISAKLGETVVHRWEHEGKIVAEMSFDVGAYSRPVYSSEKLPPATPGNWRVVVTDARGNVIRADRFSYQAF